MLFAVAPKKRHETDCRAAQTAVKFPTATTARPKLLVQQGGPICRYCEGEWSLPNKQIQCNPSLRSQNFVTTVLRLRSIVNTSMD